MDTTGMVQRWQEGERGVSPVIAVILMVAITVILAAVIGSFVLDIGGSLSEGPPEASFSAEQSSTKLCDATGSPCEDFTEVNITHQGGESIDPSNIRITVDGRQALSFTPDTDSYPDSWWSGSNPGDFFMPPTHQEVIEYNSDGEISAGQTLRVSIGSDWLSDRGGSWEAADDIYYLNKDPGTLQYSTNVNGPSNRETKDYGTTNYPLEGGETIRAVYESPNGNAQILYKYRVKG